jgi:signal transduction histidine kinase
LIVYIFENKGEMNFNNASSRFQSYLLENFWLMPVLLSIVTFLSEYVDHHHEGPLLDNREFLREVLIFSIIFPLILGVIIYYLKKIFEERNTISSDMGLLLKLGKDLSKAETWDDLLLPIRDFLQKTIPVERIYLSVFDPVDKGFKIASKWSNDFPLDDTLAPTVSELSEKSFFHSKSLLSSGTNSTNLFQMDTPNHEVQRYCLPLQLNDFIIAVVIFDLSSAEVILPEQNPMISTIIPEITMSVAHVYSREYFMDQNQSRQEERKRIARVLHDTLAQDISFLSLKLNFLREQDSLIGILEVQRDLERMQTVAQNAYDQVRGTLDSLVPEVSQNISQAIRILAHAICDPSEIQVNFTNTGQPQLLPAETKRKILNIANEALTNVVKHSGASEVNVNICWSEEQVTFEFEDHGKGFTPEESIKDQHYGLLFMRQRAESINAVLKICSSPNDGTRAVLNLPILELNPEMS